MKLRNRTKKRNYSELADNGNDIEADGCDRDQQPPADDEEHAEEDEAPDDETKSDDELQADSEGSDARRIAAAAQRKKRAKRNPVTQDAAGSARRNGDPKTAATANKSTKTKLKTTRKRRKKNEANEQKPSLPYECMYRIMQFSNVNVIHAFAGASSGIRQLVTHEVVVRSAVLGLPPRNSRSKTAISKTRERIDLIVSGLKAKRTATPSPTRLLSLLLAKQCEMPGCPFLAKSRPSPRSLEYGLSACYSCARLRMIPDGHLRHHRNITQLVPSRSFHAADVTGYWNIPHFAPNGERAGPRVTITEAMEVVAGLKRKEDIDISSDVAVDKQIIDAYDAATLRAFHYDRERVKSTSIFATKQSNIKRDQICGALKAQHPNVEWLDVATERDQANGEFKSTVMEKHVEPVIQRSLGASTRFSKTSVNKHVQAIVTVFNKIQQSGIVEFEAMPDPGNKVEEIWFERWNKKLQETSGGAWNMNPDLKWLDSFKTKPLACIASILTETSLSTVADVVKQTAKIEHERRGRYFSLCDFKIGLNLDLGVAERQFPDDFSKQCSFLFNNHVRRLSW